MGCSCSGMSLSRVFVMCEINAMGQLSLAVTVTQHLRYRHKTWRLRQRRDPLKTQAHVEDMVKYSTKLRDTGPQDPGLTPSGSADLPARSLLSCPLTWSSMWRRQVGEECAHFALGCSQHECLQRRCEWGLLGSGVTLPIAHCDRLLPCRSRWWSSYHSTPL